MNKLTLTLTLILLTITCNAQKDSGKQKYDTVLILSYQQTIGILNWIDKQHVDLQEAKQIEQIFQSHIQVIPSSPADKPKQKK